jgi:hypothetical protein
MSKPLTWIWKSKGYDDDIGLKDQSELVRTLSEDVDNQVESSISRLEFSDINDT